MLEGLFGPSYKVTQTSDLQSKGQLAKLDIRIIILQHPPIPFDEYREEGLDYGFLEVISGPMVRSSYRAERALDFNNAGL